MSDVDSQSTPSLQQQFKEAMSCFPSGVTVIMTHHEEHAVGMTASAFISVSLSPPLVLESVAKSSRMHEYLTQNDRYSVSILGADQAAVSNHYAGHLQEGYQPELSELDGLPVIKESLAQVACRIMSRVDVGDHTLFIGQVQQVQLNDTEKSALVYMRRDYHLSLPLSQARDAEPLSGGIEEADL